MNALLSTNAAEDSLMNLVMSKLNYNSRSNKCDVIDMHLHSHVRLSNTIVNAMPAALWPVLMLVRYTQKSVGFMSFHDKGSFADGRHSANFQMQTNGENIILHRVGQFIAMHVESLFFMDHRLTQGERNLATRTPLRVNTFGYHPTRWDQPKDAYYLHLTAMIRWAFEKTDTRLARLRTFVFLGPDSSHRSPPPGMPSTVVNNDLFKRFRVIAVNIGREPFSVSAYNYAARLQIANTEHFEEKGDLVESNNRAMAKASYQQVARANDLRGRIHATTHDGVRLNNIVHSGDVVGRSARITRNVTYDPDYKFDPAVDDIIADIAGFHDIDDI
jgi:hypothetical protein